MQKSDDISLLASALAKAMPKVKTALMDSVNPFFKSKYADLGAVLGAVKEALEANKLCCPQFPDHLGQEPALTTMLIHESGQWLSGTYPLMVTDKEHTPQGYGSALTYARRYGLSAVLGVIADTDDDGNAASKPAKPTAAKDPVAAEVYAPVTVSALTPKVWLENSALDVKVMGRAELDDFCSKQADRMARVRTLNPAPHKALVDAIKARYETLG